MKIYQQAEYRDWWERNQLMFVIEQGTRCTRLLVNDICRQGHDFSQTQYYNSIYKEQT